MGQLDLFAPTKCVFTGHRDLEENFDEDKLVQEIEKLILRGVTEFYNGMAMGFDLLAAEKVLFLKEKYPQIRLIACIPFPKQEKKFSDLDKARYAKILKNADEKVLLFDRYFDKCFLKRDEYMAERGEVMIAYCRRKTGGTAYTVRYFGKVRPSGEIIFL